MTNYFTELLNINVNDKKEKKGGLDYLSWAFAWAEVKKKHPDATYKIYHNNDGWIYFTDGRTCWVETGVTVNGIEHVESLHVMDFRNKSIPLDKVTSSDVTTTIQRALTKACARHGLGLYIYAGEDLPSALSDEEPEDSIIVKEEPVSLSKMIRECKTIDELEKIYSEHKAEIVSNRNVLDLVTLKGKELSGEAA